VTVTQDRWKVKANGSLPVVWNLKSYESIYINIVILLRLVLILKLGQFFNYISPTSVGDSPGKWLISLLALALVIESYQVGVKRSKLTGVSKPQLIKENK
jgi:hypothetical protein